MSEIYLDEFETIMNKWADVPTPSNISGLLELKPKNAVPLIFALSALAIKAGADKKRTMKLGEELAEKVGLVKKRAFVIGVEHSSLMDMETQPKLLAEQVNMKLDYEEWCIVAACLEATQEYILRKSKITNQALSRTEEDVRKRVEDVRDTVQKFGMQATEGLPEYDLLSKAETYKTHLNLIATAVGSVEDMLEYYGEKWANELHESPEKR